jgi:hypothetical protein
VKADKLLHTPRLESAFCRFFTGVRTRFTSTSD